MDNLPFVGRPYEIERLNDLLKKKTASLVVIKGRRRIGKSRLVEEFARNKAFYSFSGLAPSPETTAESQRDEFARQFGEQFKLPGIRANDWGDLFALLAKYTATGQAIILLDEITWMGSKDPDFLGKLKIAWDLYFSKNPQLILILCGSISSWIEKNIISSTGFFGRISLIITLSELTLNECNLFLEKEGFKKSALEKFMLLAITGGIPWYLEIINPKAPVSENIKNLCFTPDGLLVDEFKKIFHDLFGRRGNIFQEIVKYLAKQPAEYTKLAKALNYPSGGPLSEYLEDLVMSSFVSRDFTWKFQSGQDTAISRFRKHYGITI